MEVHHQALAFKIRQQFLAQNDASRGAPNVPATVAHWVRLAR
jgi:hypothetical protein